LAIAHKVNLLDLADKMGKTTRKQPEWMREDDRWMRKGAKHEGPSRKKGKQDFMREIDDYFDNRR